MKAFIHHHGASILKTHDVSRLIEAASPFESGFGAHESDADLLTPLATSFRYPDESDWSASPEPTRAEFENALSAAQRIYDFVLSALPPETHPA